VLAVGIHRHRSLAHLRANSMHVGGLCVQCGLVLGSCCSEPLSSMAQEANLVDISVPEQHATAYDHWKGMSLPVPSIQLALSCANCMYKMARCLLSSITGSPIKRTWRCILGLHDPFQLGLIDMDHL